MSESKTHKRLELPTRRRRLQLRPPPPVTSQAKRFFGPLKRTRVRMGQRKQQGAQGFLGAPLQIGMGVAGIVLYVNFGALGSIADCGRDLALPLFAMGITNLIVGFFQLMIGICGCGKCKVAAGFIIIFKALAYLGGLAAFGLSVWGSVWTWQYDTMPAQLQCMQTALWFASHVYFIVAWTAPVGWCILLLIVTAVILK
eukprot:TRINITY_DN1140_c0_g1_i8.p4 TRINITY_DN1140_c0_g1~~TRINITY_DN1140_c0_g1_i8.p4  ORF type:complete len:199 (-),score=32.47 TRINITY_DN1140_c0_g1_i8:1061-1657(-)